MRAGMVGGDLLAVAQRGMADVILKPPLDDIDLLNWQAFEEVISRGYHHARSALESLPQIPRSRDTTSADA
jgi:predicted acylesterase/phospholipase RssA